MSLPAFLHHGTSTGYFSQIIRDGLNPESGGGYLCYTDEFETAWYHAQCMANWDSSILETVCSPIVFVIPIERFARSSFCLDRNFIRLAPSAGRAVGQPLPKRRWNWYALLKHAGSVGYRGTVEVMRADLFRAPPDYLDVSEDGGIAVPPALAGSIIQALRIPDVPAATNGLHP